MPENASPPAQKSKHAPAGAVEQVRVSNLHKRFGSLHAVQGISFKLYQGEVLGFLGPNGAGKSTTMKMITGFMAPSAGDILVCGHDVQERPLEIKRRIGYLPEGAPTYGEMKVNEFLRFIGAVRRLRGPALHQAIDRTVRLVHLESVLQQTIETLSKGFKRRVGMAQAILHDPPVLIMDEPTDGLDPNQKHEVRELIRNMAEHKAIIISTHILEEVDAACTRAMIIANGKICFQGTPDELRARSKNANLDEAFRTLTLGREARTGAARHS